MARLKRIVKETHDNPEIAVIWLHGLGADGSDFVPALPYLGLPKSARIRFIFPCARVQPVTVNNGLSMPSWYDIKAMLPSRVIDEEQLALSVQGVEQIIAEQLELGIKIDNIVLVGFSQGGALAYEVALNSTLAIASVAAMSTYVPRLLTDYSSDRQLNILAIHGTEDDVVPCALGEQSVQHLQEKGYTVQWCTFAMAHEVSIASLELLGKWISDLQN